jgi:nucleoside-diphosphate-sugar epimerase
MASVLVTGGTGFVGLHLVEALVRRGDQVRALVRPGSSSTMLRALGVEIVAGELSDLAALKVAMNGVQVVHHVAGVIRAFRKGDFFQVNEHGTARVAEACAAQSSPPRLVIVSSVAATGPAPRGQIRTEGDLPSPVSHYGQSKLAGEQAAAKLAATVPITIVRPGVVFGPRDNGFVQVLRTLRLFRCHLSPGFFPPALSCIHVTDLVDLLLRAADRGRTLPAQGNGDWAPGRYFAAAPEYPTYVDLGRMMRPMLGRPFAPIIPIPAALSYMVAGINEFVGRVRGRPEELSIDKIRDALATNWACSGESARRELDFVPAKPLAERMRETIDWYLAAGSI